jgi:RND family efflux transporter MFP subunit
MITSTYSLVNHWLVSLRPVLMRSGVMLLAVLCLPVAAEEYSCVTEPRQEAVLSFAVSGRITDIKHREGRSVKAGTVLVELDNVLEVLEVERRKLVLDDRSQLSSALSQSEMIKQILASTQSLFDSTGSVSREDLKKTELESKTSAAEYNRLLSMEKREEVEYRLSLANLARRTLKAPFAGTIVDIMLNEGEISEANQPMVKLVDVSQGFLICNVEEPAGRTLENGTTLPIEIQAGFSRWQSVGTVVFVAPVVDPASGLLRVKIEFENDAGEVRQGMPGYVSIYPTERTDSIGPQQPSDGASIPTS